MKLTYLTIALMCLMIRGESKMSDFKTGIISTMVLNRVNKPEPKITEKYYNKITIDTSLFDFPKQINPKCIEIKSYIRMTFSERLRTSLIITVIIMIPVYLYRHGTESDRDFMVGCLVGSLIK